MGQVLKCHLVRVAGVSPQGSSLAAEARVVVLRGQKQRVVPSMRETQWWPASQASGIPEAEGRGLASL